MSTRGGFVSNRLKIQNTTGSSGFLRQDSSATSNEPEIRKAWPYEEIAEPEGPSNAPAVTNLCVFSSTDIIRCTELQTKLGTHL